MPVWPVDDCWTSDTMLTNYDGLDVNMTFEKSFLDEAGSPISMTEVLHWIQIASHMQNIGYYYHSYTVVLYRFPSILPTQERSQPSPS